MKEIMELVESDYINLSDVNFIDMTIPVEVFKQGLDEMDQDWGVFIENQRASLGEGFKETAEKRLDDVLEVRQDLNKKTDWTLEDDTLFQQLSQELQDIQNAIDNVDIELAIKISEDSQVNADNFISTVKSIGDEIENVNNTPLEIKSPSNMDYVKSINDAIVGYKNAVNEFEKTYWVDKVNSALSSYKSSIDGVNYTWEEYLSLHKRIAQDTTSLSAQLDSLQSSWKTVADASSEFNETGKYSIDTFQALLQLSPEYLAALDLESGKLIVNEEKVRALTDAMKEEAISKLQNAAVSDIKAYADGRVEEASDLAKEAVRKLGENAEIAGQQLAEGAIGASSFAEAVNAILSGEDIDTSNITNIADAITDAYAGVAGKINGIKIDFSDLSKGSSSKKSTEPYKVEIEATKLLQAELQKVNELLSQNDKLFKAAEGNKDKQSELIKERNSLLEQQKSLLHEINEVNRGTISSNIQELSKHGIKISYTPEINKLSIHNTAEEIQQIFNNIKIGDVENTNKVKKELESLLNNTIKLNEENDKNSSQWLDIQQSVKQTTLDLMDIDYSNSIEDANSKIENLNLLLKQVSETDFDTKLELINQQMSEQSDIVSLLEAQIQKYREALDEGSISEETFKQKYDELYKALQNAKIVEIQLNDDNFNTRLAEIENRNYQLEFDLSIAEDTGDFNRQLEIYRQFQEDALQIRQMYIEEGRELTDRDILDQEKKYRYYNSQMINVFQEQFDSVHKTFDKQYSKLDFKLSITSDTDYAEQERLISEQIENRIAKTKELINQMTYLRLSTDENMKSTQAYKNLMDSLDSTYTSQIKSVYDLANAKKSLAESQIAAISDLQDDLVNILKEKYNKEAELLKERYDSNKKALEQEKQSIKAQYDAEIKYIDSTLAALKKMWDAEDARKRKQEDLDDIGDIQAKINSLKIAA